MTNETKAALAGGEPLPGGEALCPDCGLPHPSTNPYCFCHPAEPAQAGVDWEQRRWEAMRDILAGWCANPQVRVSPGTSPGAALELADALIAAAKGGQP